MKQYSVDNNRFIISNYDKAKKFSSFLPAIAGEDGKPMWVFYANEGQCVASFGVDSKEHPLLPFDSALLAYQNLSLKCFRTIIYLGHKIIQPFIDKGQTSLIVERSKIEISWENSLLKVNVVYSTVSKKDYPGLIRKVTILNKSDIKELSVIDGLPVFLPKGLSNYMYKNLTTLASAYCVSSIDKYPFYRYTNRGGDDSEIILKNDGSGFSSFMKENSAEIRYIVDKDIIFSNESLTQIRSLKDVEKRFEKQAFNKIPSAFAFLKSNKQSIEFVSLYSVFNSKDEFKQMVDSLDYSKLVKEIDVTEKLVDSILPNIETSNENLNNYIKQSYLDNYLRGGYPTIIENKPFYLYSRKHGDMERDYNDFVIPSTYFSSGLGNYRDINQNRRNDLLVEPRINDYNLYLFFSLIENNGFNPLIVDISILNKEYHSYQEALEHVKKQTIDNIKASFATGYWIDHWVYNIDLLENYLAVYPDKVSSLLNEKKYRFFDSGVIIKPRSERYVLTEKGLRQYNSLEIIKDYKNNWLTNSQGIIEVSLASKIFDLILKKYITLDADQMGLEMLSDKPGWNDSCNGLPGLFGSSMNETIELLRLVKLFKQLLSETNCKVELTEASYDLYKKINTLNYDGFEYWDKQNEYFETFNLEYRSKTELVEIDDYSYFLNKVEKALAKGIKKAKNYGENIIPAYFIHEFEKTSQNSFKLIKTIAFPPFLEAPARLLKLGKSFMSKKEVGYIRKSDLFDQKYKLLKTSVSLDDVTDEIGRTKSFAPGWLERESDFLHMSFKYLLGLLKAGYYDEFFKLAKTNLPCFMKPEIYGRPIFENVSFIVPSNHPDTSKHGTGNYARLTGANTEVINMLQLVLFGEHIFVKDDKGIKFNFKCHIPLTLFKNKQIKTSLFDMEVIISNPNNKDYKNQNNLKYEIDNKEVLYLDKSLLEDIRLKKAKHSLKITIL